MELKRPQDILALASGTQVTKRDLYDLIQYSKVEGSSYWGGSAVAIGNTPQQGINWIGAPPRCHGLIIKTRPGRYAEDGWSDNGATYRYSFKARKGRVSFNETANSVLIQQPQHLYPIQLLTEHGSNWLFQGTFTVAEILDTFVVLQRGAAFLADSLVAADEVEFPEGERRYVSHLMAERNREVVHALKQEADWVCDICGLCFTSRYNVDYIEAHHKVPIATYSASRVVKLSDFALLCPNCHKAVHIHMKIYGHDYDQIRAMLRTSLNA